MKESERKNLEERATKIKEGQEQLEARAFRILHLVRLELIPKPERRWFREYCPKCHKPLKLGYTKVCVYTYYYFCPCGYEYAFQEDGGG